MFTVWALKFLAQMYRFMMGNKARFPSCLVFCPGQGEYISQQLLNSTNLAWEPNCGINFFVNSLICHQA
jgi:hypothetical protein